LKVPNQIIISEKYFIIVLQELGFGGGGWPACTFPATDKRLPLLYFWNSLEKWWAASYPRIFSK
jgi:hypothetical protein